MSTGSAFTDARRGMIYAIACELADTSPELLTDSSPEEIFKSAAEFGVSAMVAASLSRAGLATDSMRAALNMSIRRAILMDHERRRVSDALTSLGIRHAFLKGTLLKDLYPSVGLREMTDCDVLFDHTFRSSLRDAMVSLGYTVGEYGSGCHDVYIKEPIYNFEMHVSLFSPLESQILSDYFECALDRAAATEGSSALCVFSPEDQYVYVKAHEYKHYSLGGTGIRSLLDTYVYAEALGDSLDNEYVEMELSKLGISDFCRRTLALSRKLFSLSSARSFYMGELQLTPDEESMLSYYFGSGLYGNIENKVANALSDKGGRFQKIRYLLRRIFPPMEWYKVNAPFYYKYKILIPVFVVKRAVVRLFKSPRKHIGELNALIKTEGNTRDESDLQKKG